MIDGTTCYRTKTRARAKASTNTRASARNTKTRARASAKNRARATTAATTFVITPVLRREGGGSASKSHFQCVRGLAYPQQQLPPSRPRHYLFFVVVVVVVVVYEPQSLWGRGRSEFAHFIGCDREGQGVWGVLIVGMGVLGEVVVECSWGGGG